MEKIKYTKGTVIYKAGEPVSTLGYISSGKVDILCDGFTLTMKPGCIIGLFEQAGAPYSFNYVASEDVTVAEYTYNSSADVSAIVEDFFSDCEMIVTASAALTISAFSRYSYYKKNSDKFINLISSSYNDYKNICSMYRLNIQAFPLADELAPYTPDEAVPEWINDYYDQIEIMPKHIKQDFFGIHASLGTSYLLESSQHIKIFLSMCAEICGYTNSLIDKYFVGKKGDIFDLYMNLQDIAEKSGTDRSIFDEIHEQIEIYISELGKNPLVSNSDILKKYSGYLSEREKEETDDESMAALSYDRIDHSLDTILSFSNLDDAEADRFRYLVKQYRALPDKNSQLDEDHKLRQEISKYFFDIYEAAVISSMENTKIPTILKMFFYFGYMDEGLIGKDNAMLLYDMAENINYSGQNGIYTIYDWLTSIYRGEHEPSINEFDQDYVTYLRTQRQSGYISEEMEKRYLTSPKEKMRFELMNFFKTAMKISSGRNTGFCPLLSQHNVIRPLEKVVVSAADINKGWDTIKAIDYSLFYRECMYQNLDYKITRDTILLEVTPNIILMPGIGQRAGLWQETEGANRNSAGRMFLPIFLNEDLLDSQIKLAAEFRWNICKRVHGARWNDVTDHSLTSEYFDYLQFYRKNSELSPDTKEKIRSQLNTNKNIFKNVFMQDYKIWIKFEMNGSPRLNKYVKQILFTHCPPAKKVRDRLREHPLYKDMIILHENKAAKKFKVLGAYYTKFQKSDKATSEDNNLDSRLPAEIIRYVGYYRL